MPRTAHSTPGNYCYHVFNRGNGRSIVFHKDGDFAAFLDLLRQAGERPAGPLAAVNENAGPAPGSLTAASCVRR